MLPIEDNDTIIFKLTKGYITSANIFVDLVNIDSSNCTLEMYDANSTYYSVSIPSKMYTTIDEIMEEVLKRLSEIGFNCTFNDMTLTFDNPIRIVANKFTDFIGLIVGSTYDYILEQYITTYKLCKNTLAQPTTLYAILSISKTVSENVLKTFENITNGQITFDINYQNDYDDLYLLFSSNVNNYPLKYNLSSTLTIVSS